jgi:hypothetical protein
MLTLSEENQKLHEENKSLRAILLRSEIDLKLAIEAVTRLQRESTEMLEHMRVLKARISHFEALAYMAREACNCDAMTGLLDHPPDVIRHLKSHIESLKEVLDACSSS